MIKKSFTLRVLAVSFLLLALPLLIDSFIFFQNAYQNAITAAKKQLKEEANLRTYSLMASAPVKQVLLNEMDYVLNLSTQIEKRQFDHLSNEFQEIVKLWGRFRILLLEFEKDGFYKIVAASEEKLVNTYFLSNQQFDFVIEKGSGTFLRYLYSQTTQEYLPYLFEAQMIYSKDSGQPIGILLVASNFEKQIETALAPGSQLRNVQFAILNADDIIIKSSDPLLGGQFLTAISPERRRQILVTRQLGDIQLSATKLPVLNADNPPFFEFVYHGQAQIAYQVHIPGTNLSLLAFTPKKEYFSAAVRHFLLLYIVYLLILIGGGAVTFWLSHWISRPLRQLTHVMGKVSEGHLDVRFKEAPLGFEINILGGMFNQTLDTLLHNIQQAEDERIKKQTFQKELELSQEVQKSLLPVLVPHVKGATAAGVYLQGQEAGGDFFAFSQKKTKKGEELLTIAVTDVADKGLTSCLYSLTVRSLYQAYLTLSDDIGEILHSTNQAFIQDTEDTGMYAQFFLGFYFIESRVFSYYTCGYIQGVIRRSDGTIEQLKQQGIALGLKSWGKLTPDTLQLRSGDILLLYTKGLLFLPAAEKKLNDLLQKQLWETAQGLANAISAEVLTNASETSQEEEVIIAILKVE